MVVRFINRPGFCKISGEWGLTSLVTKPIHHKTPFIWRKLVPGRRLTRLPVARASQLFLHFLTKLDEPLFVKEQKVGSTAKRLIPPHNPHPTLHLGGSSTNWPTFLHMYVYLTLGLPTWVNSVNEGNTIRTCAGAYGSSWGVNVFLTWTLGKVDNCIQIIVPGRSRTLFYLPCVIRIVNYLKDKPRISTLYRVG